jgi:hypothetical protein
MKQTYLNSGTYTYKPLKGKLDLEAYIISVLAKDTCCNKNILADSITNTAGTMFAGFMPVALAQALSPGSGAAGVVNVTSYLTKFTSNGTNALTLANGTQTGQLKKIYHVVDGGSGVLTPVSLTGGTTITFTTAGEYAILLWNGTTWNAIELSNTTAGGASPALA